ncbi:MAG: MFS transporter [Chloroflexota bacterium]|nr:MFS transporter [Chloroflexota bacterium]
MSGVGETRRDDFWKFFTGQALSALGTSFTQFALPLLVYELTRSPTTLAVSFASGVLPYLLFGLVGGAWADRADRKRLMIRTDLLRAAVLASVPILYHLDALPLWWIYAAGFVTTTLGILFESAEFAAIPSLVSGDDLVEANGRISASFTAATLLGPPLAGLLAGLMPVANVLGLDALSFVVSALSLALVRASFNPRDAEGRERRSLRTDVVEGLAYVWRHPVLRNISIMMALVNFVAVVVVVQLVLFAKERLGATDFQYGLLVSAGSGGVIVLSLAAGPLRRRLPFGVVALGALALSGTLTVAFALAPGYWVALPLWAAIPGLATLFNINTASLRQAIVPNHLLGRIISVARVAAASATPLGALLGGWLVARAGVTFTYVLSGALTVLIAAVFAFSPLGHAEDYLEREELRPAAEPEPEPVAT